MSQKSGAVQPLKISVGLSAVVLAVTEEEPKVLAIRSARSDDALPSGPLEPNHRTLETGLRAWVEAQTGQKLGYVEQLYTFGDRYRDPLGSDLRSLSIGYLALVSKAGDAGVAEWRDWYRYFPWEDWRGGRPEVLAKILSGLRKWAQAASTPAEKKLREARVRRTFGSTQLPWNDEPVLERYELLYEARLVSEAHRDRGQKGPWPAEVIVEGEPMAADHRRILATAISRLRGKIKYRPVVFELMPPNFPLGQLQATVEALAGVRLHKPNFRRLVEGLGLVEETGQTTTATGGRPARLVQFRKEVLLERLAPGFRLPIAKL
ncbi:MAG TPA: hypothetical protein VJM53_01345 [Burkholderiales bacterium]|nr:hypothetical protein [Burkholderiales bacterium]